MENVEEVKRKSKEKENRYGKRNSGTTLFYIDMSETLHYNLAKKVKGGNMIEKEELVKIVDAGNVMYEQMALDEYSRDMSFVNTVRPAVAVSMSQIPGLPNGPPRRE